MTRESDINVPYLCHPEMTLSILMISGGNALFYGQNFMIKLASNHKVLIKNQNVAPPTSLACLCYFQVT